MKYVQVVSRQGLAALRAGATSVVTMGFLLAGVICTAQFSNAQISDQINVDMSHSFIVGNTTLPPGKYSFRMLTDTDLSAMTVTSADGKHSVEFLVNNAQADHTPQHSELTFARCGQKEFLTKIFEQGSKIGVAVAETPREELRLQKSGQQLVEHTEPSQGN